MVTLVELGNRHSSRFMSFPTCLFYLFSYFGVE